MTANYWPYGGLKKFQKRCLHEDSLPVWLQARGTRMHACMHAHMRWRTQMLRAIVNARTTEGRTPVHPTHGGAYSIIACQRRSRRQLLRN